MARKKKEPAESENPLLDYDSHQLLEAVDQLDNVRPILSDEGFNPPEIRTQLLKLHGMVMGLKNISGLNLQGKKDLSHIMELAGDIDMEIFDCVGNLERIRDTLEKLLSKGEDEDLEDLRDQETI